MDENGAPRTRSSLSDSIRPSTRSDGRAVRAHSYCVRRIGQKTYLYSLCGAAVLLRVINLHKYIYMNHCGVTTESLKSNDVPPPGRRRLLTAYFVSAERVFA